MSLINMVWANHHADRKSDLLEETIQSALDPSPLTLVLGPSGSGKSEWVVERFSRNRGRSLLIVPSPQQADTFADWIAQRTGQAAADVRGAILPFRTLPRELDPRGDTSDGGVIGRSFQRLALTDLVPLHIRRDDFLGRMLDAPGFVASLAERIREWKLAGVTPDALEKGGASAAITLEDPSVAMKTRELARLFRAYENFLAQNHILDEEDVLTRAVDHVESRQTPLPWNADLVLVDGFYRFNRAQLQLLKAIAARGAPGTVFGVELAITLCHDVGRSLLFAAPQRTLEQLRIHFQPREVRLAGVADRHAPVLNDLSARLFGRTDEAHPQSSRAEPLPSGSALQLFDAPNPYVEAEMVAREFRRVHDAGGYRWSDFAVVLRAMGDYTPILSAVFERYEIPLGIDGPEILSENPLVKTLLNLLAIVREDWQRDDVIAFLKSSYTDADKIGADNVRKRARRKGIRGGRENWLALVEDGDERLDGAVRQTLQDIARFDSEIARQRADPVDLAQKVREAITLFGLEARIDLGEPGRAERDRAACKEAMDILDAVARMSRISGRRSVSFAEFHAELLAAWQSTTAIGSAAGEYVRVVEPYDAHERPIRVGAVMGLTERVFPRRATEDPFLRDEERVALKQTAGLELEEQRNRADDERFFFYLAVTAPTQRLTLSFPRSSDESDTLPSFYIDEVRAALGGRILEGAGGAESEPRLYELTTISRTLADVAPRPEEAVSPRDTLVSACADLFDPGAEPEAGQRSHRMRRAAESLRACLAEDATRQMLEAVIGSRRLPALPGLVALDVRSDFASRKTVFSVSELETYQQCPFQYLLRHVLRLHPEEEDGGARLEGALMHAALRRYYRKRKATPPAVAEATEATEATAMEGMRVGLREALDTELGLRPIDVSPHRLRMTKRMLADALDRYAEREARFGPQFGMAPTYFELAFGFGAAGAALVEEEDRLDPTRDEKEGMEPVHDRASLPDPLRIAAPDGRSPISICGIIDRVDLDLSGQRALVLDYKLGRPPDFSDIQRGLSLQMPLYLLAIERLFGVVGAVGCYDSMAETGRRRFQRAEHINLRQFAPIIPLDDGATVKPLNRDQYAELTRTAEAAVIRTANAIAASRVEATPGDHCRQCAYGDVCRTTIAGGHDGETPGLPER